MREQISEPAVTIIVPTYRRPTLLKRAINSIQNQTYSNIKIYVCDDASGDDTEQVVTEIANNDSRILYHCNEKNLGPLDNAGNAMLKVDTPFFAFCADDDLFLPCHLENAMGGFEQYPDAGFSINETIAMDNNGWVPFVSTFDMKQGMYDPHNAIMLLLKKEAAMLLASVIRKEVIEKIGALNLDCGALGDWDFCFRAAAQFPFVITKKPGTIYGIHSSNFFASEMSQHQWLQWQKYFQNSIENPFLDEKTKEAVEYHLSRRLRSMVKNQGWEAIINKNYDTADLCIQILKDFFKSTRYPLKLGLLRLTCKIFPPFRWYLKLIKNLRYKKKIFKSNIRYRDYQKYRKFMNG